MASRNDITGDVIATKGVSSAYRDNYDAIFRKKVEEPTDPAEELARKIYNQHCELDAEMPAWTDLSPAIREAFVIAALSQLADELEPAPVVVVKEEPIVVKEVLPAKTDAELAQELRDEQTRKWWTYLERTQKQRKDVPSFTEFRDTILPTLPTDWFTRS